MAKYMKTEDIDLPSKYDCLDRDQLRKACLLNLNEVLRSKES